MLGVRPAKMGRSGIAVLGVPVQPKSRLVGAPIPLPSWCHVRPARLPEWRLVPLALLSCVLSPGNRPLMCSACICLPDGTSARWIEETGRGLGDDGNLCGCARPVLIGRAALRASDASRCSGCRRVRLGHAIRASSPFCPSSFVVVRLRAGLRPPRPPPGGRGRHRRRTVPRRRERPHARVRAN